jgi:hypothetical protein
MVATAHVMLIRHAEKPDEDAGILGVDEQGRPDADALSVRGWQRAGALAQLFRGGHGPRGGPGPAGGLLAPPAAIFAATDPNKSRRPLCTVQPLARLLDVPVDTRFGSEGDPAALLQAVQAARGPVLLCWRHQAMAGVARALCGGQPPAWDEARYDLVWVFERQGERWRRTEMPQRLLAGDA